MTRFISASLVTAKRRHSPAQDDIPGYFQSSDECRRQYVSPPVAASAPLRYAAAVPNEQSGFHLETRDDGLAVVTIDLPDRPVNVIRNDFFPAIESMIGTIESDPLIKGVILRSGKRESFVAGADLDLVSSFTSAEEARSFIRRGQAILDQIAASPKAWVAAIHGAAMGGGLELCLACHARVATDHPATVLALPEVMVGLLPAGGGTQRLPRLIGLPQSLAMMLTGKRVRARKAQSLGLVDRVCHPDDLMREAASLAQLGSDRVAPFAQTASRFPLIRSLILRKARRDTLKRTRGVYPAPLAILDCVATGLSEGYERGVEQEALSFARLALGRESRKLIWLFNATGELKKTDTSSARPLNRIGVLGAGLMGEGIAAVTLPVAEVHLADISKSSLERARTHIAESLDKRVASGSLTPDDAETQRARLTLHQEAKDVRSCDVVIEAVFEDLELKRTMFRTLERNNEAATILATNTSAIPIASIAEAVSAPARVVGMHYFSPVPKMPLLEIVRGESTSDAAVDTAVKLGLAQGKVPVVVRDGPGFYTTRILAPLINEAVILVEEGNSIQAIDSAMKNAGFPVGPITLLDEVGLDIAAHVSSTLGKAFSARGHTPSTSLKKMVEAGLLGRKSGEGFYIWKPDLLGRRKRPGTHAVSLVRVASDVAEPSEIVDRCTLAMVNEAVHCYQEGVIPSPLVGDVAAVLGLGFPPFRGGPFHYVDTFGAKVIVARLRELAVQKGARFAPASQLLEMAAADIHYYQ